MFEHVKSIEKNKDTETYPLGKECYYDSLENVTDETGRWLLLEVKYWNLK